MFKKFMVCTYSKISFVYSIQFGSISPIINNLKVDAAEIK